MGFSFPIVIEHLGAAIPYFIATRIIGEEVIHGPVPGTYIPEGLFQDIGSSDGPPKLFVKIIVMEAVEELFFHTFESTLLLNDASRLGGSKAPGGSLGTFPGEHQFGLPERIEAH